MKSQHEEMICDVDALRELTLEDLTPANMAEMTVALAAFDFNLTLAAAASKALGRV